MSSSCFYFSIFHSKVPEQFLLAYLEKIGVCDELIYGYLQSVIVYVRYPQNNKHKH